MRKITNKTILTGFFLAAAILAGGCGSTEQKPSADYQAENTISDTYMDEETFSDAESDEEVSNIDDDTDADSDDHDSSVDDDADYDDTVQDEETYSDNNTQNDDMESKADEEAYEYVTIDDFSIVGTWRNIGTYGFGQAQPGAAVVFNETNCNYYSPNDTYAFYRDNGKWKLSCTSPFGGDTVTFTVRTIDNDNIHIGPDLSLVQLKRVN